MSESSQSDKESSATPRTDAIAATHDEAAAWVERTAGYNELLEHARDLEREIDQWRAISKEASRVAPSAGLSIKAWSEMSPLERAAYNAGVEARSMTDEEVMRSQQQRIQQLEAQLATPSATRRSATQTLGSAGATICRGN
jgi:hypothetical protein